MLLNLSGCPSGRRPVLNALHAVLFVSSGQNFLAAAARRPVGEQSVPASVGGSFGLGGFGLPVACNINCIGNNQMHNIIYLVGLIVVVLAILSFVA
jgi:cytochrome c biogenesis protein CcdA